MGGGWAWRCCGRCGCAPPCGLGSPHEAAAGHVSRGVRKPRGLRAHEPATGGRAGQLPLALVSRALLLLSLSVRHATAGLHMMCHYQMGTGEYRGPPVSSLCTNRLRCGPQGRLPTRTARSNCGIYRHSPYTVHRKRTVNFQKKKNKHSWLVEKNTVWWLLLVYCKNKYC